MHPNFVIPALLASALLAGCAGGGPSTPSMPFRTAHLPSLDQVAGPAHVAGAGMAEGLLGAVQVHIDPASMTARVEPLRVSQTQGDLYNLSIRPFFGPGDLEVTRVRRGGPGTVAVTVKFRHPFDAPADLNQPASASKRIDLHVFDVNALVVADGNDAFFTGSDAVVTNGDLLVNADAYRNSGGMFAASSLGVTTANTFPYKLVAKNLDTVNPSGNYVPTANGWTGPTLLDPFGYDVFPQGAEVEVDFELAVDTSPLNFYLVTLAKYMDPRATPQPKTKRLPSPGDPTSLRYFLPEASGDVQRIAVDVSGELESGSTSEVAGVDVEILDWDHGATVAVPFPNDADLSQIAENSDVESVSASIPQLRASGPFAFPAVTGTAPLLITTGAVTNEDSFLAPSGAVVKGMVRVTDAQDTTPGREPIVLDESLQPSAPLASTRYQVFRIVVNGTGPTCMEYAPGAAALEAIEGLAFRLDLDTAVVPASDPDGIAGYRVDYTADGLWDTGFRLPDGTPAPDFTADPAWFYAAAGTETLRVEIRDNNIPPDSTICEFTVTVDMASGIVFDQPDHAGINVNMGSQQVLANASCRTPLTAERTGNDVYQLLIQNINGPYMVYRSLDGGLTWPGPNGNPLPNWANGNVTPTNSNFGMGILANGLPAVGVRDAGFDLAYIAAQSESAGSITWGPASNGVEIETAGSWTQVCVVPHPTNANRVYLIAQNTSTTVGPNSRQISLWLSTNGASANPTFTLLPTIADSLNAGATIEDYIKAEMDTTGAIHIAWTLGSTNQVFYRKFVDDGTANGGTWSAVEVVIGTKVGPAGSFFSSDIALNSVNEPAVTWIDEDPDARPANVGNMVMLTKFNTATGWTAQRRISQTGVAYENNIFYPDVAFDGSNRIHVVWRDTRDFYPDITNVIYEVWGSVSSADGLTTIVPDFEIFNGPNKDNDFPQMPRAVYSSGSGRIVVTSDVFDNLTAIADGRYRYRTYQLIP